MASPPFSSGTLAANGNLDLSLATSGQFAKRVVGQVTGTFGGGTVAVSVSSDGGTTFTAAMDSSGAQITFTVADLKQVVAFGFWPFSHARFALSGAAGPSLTIKAFLGD